MSRSLTAALEEAGGAGAPAAQHARLRELAGQALQDGANALREPRSGYEDPVVVLVAVSEAHALAALPLAANARADLAAAPDRAWALAAAAVGTLAELAGLGAPGRPEELALTVAPYREHLVAALPLSTPLDPADVDELAPLAFEEQLGRVDRLRARALGVPAALLAEAEPQLAPPIGSAHPLRVAEAVARLGGRAVNGELPEALEDAVAALLQDRGATAARPHEDPEPARRVARRILQRLSGMGKWGGYHTEFRHLARGFDGNDRRLAAEVGEALLQAGLLQQKPSVGQRHVFLNPRRAGDIHRLVDNGIVPADLHLPET